MPSSSNVAVAIVEGGDGETPSQSGMGSCHIRFMNDKCVDPRPCLDFSMGKFVGLNPSKDLRPSEKSDPNEPGQKYGESTWVGIYALRLRSGQSTWCYLELALHRAKFNAE